MISNVRYPDTSSHAGFEREFEVISFCPFGHDTKLFSSLVFETQRRTKGEVVVAVWLSLFEFSPGVKK